MYEAHGSEYRVFVSQSDTLAGALQEAANAVSGIELLDRTAAIRVLHNYDHEGHTIALMVEADPR